MCGPCEYFYILYLYILFTRTDWNRLEEKLQRNNIRDVKNGMKQITGFWRKNREESDGNLQQANKVNCFFQQV